MEARYLVRNLDFTIKPLPSSTLKGKIPQDLFQAHASKDLNWFCYLSALLPISCITLGMSLTFSEPQLSNHKMDILIELL